MSINAKRNAILEEAISHSQEIEFELKRQQQKRAEIENALLKLLEIARALEKKKHDDWGEQEEQP